MIQLPECDKKFLLELNETYGLSTVIVDTSSSVFSKELEKKVSTDGEEMEAYYNHIHLMELGAELEHEAKLHGSFRILISDGAVRTQRI